MLILLLVLLLFGVTTFAEVMSSPPLLKKGASRAREERAEGVGDIVVDWMEEGGDIIAIGRRITELVHCTARRSKPVTPIAQPNGEGRSHRRQSAKEKDGWGFASCPQCLEIYGTGQKISQA